MSVRRCFTIVSRFFVFDFQFDYISVILKKIQIPVNSSKAYILNALLHHFINRLCGRMSADLSELFKDYSSLLSEPVIGAF